MKDAHLIDISAVFFRYYFGPTPAIVNDDGWDISALLFSLRWLCKAEFIQADVTVAAFDESLGTGFRHQLDEDYKANRALPTEDIVYQLSALKVFCEYLGFAVVASDDLEADDLIGAASVQLSNHNCMIHSRDKDLRQLLNERVIMKDLMTEKIWDQGSLKSETGLTPDQIPLYLALMGDSSDNIIGLPGIGDKTATTLLTQCQTWQGILSAVNAEEKFPVRGSDRIKSTLLEYQELVDHNLQLTLLKTHDSLDLNTRQFDQASYEMINALAEQFGMQSKLKKALGIISELIK